MIQFKTIIKVFNSIIITNYSKMNITTTEHNYRSNIKGNPRFSKCKLIDVVFTPNLTVQ